jgi:hypothetical protein
VLRASEPSRFTGKVLADDLIVVKELQNEEEGSTDGATSLLDNIDEGEYTF